VFVVLRGARHCRAPGATRLSAQSVAHVMKAAAARIPGGFAGHSLRRGFVTSAIAVNVPLEQIVRHARHRSIQTTLGYAEQRTCAAVRPGIGLGNDLGGTPLAIAMPADQGADEPSRAALPSADVAGESTEGRLPPDEARPARARLTPDRRSSMPRRSVLSTSDRATLVAPPDDDGDKIRLYTFSDTDLALVRERRGEANRLGFAVQLCLLRYPGLALSAERAVDEGLIRWVAEALWLDAAAWTGYAERDTTRRQHRGQLMAYLQLSAFGASAFRSLVRELTELALQNDQGLLLGGHALTWLRRQRIVVPPLPVIDRACAHALARADRALYHRLTGRLDDGHRARLDALLEVRPGGGAITWLTWLRQSPLTASARVMLAHIERLRCYRGLDLPDGLGRDVHHNRLAKIARSGAQMRPWDLGDFETERRHATLAALALDGRATVTDEIIELHDRIMIKLVATARNKHLQRFQDEGRAINDKVRLYVSVGRVRRQTT